MVGLATFRLSTSPLHRHCYSSQQDELQALPVRTRIAGQRARPACALALQAFRCVGAWVCAHTPGGRAGLVRTAAARAGRRPALPSSSSSLSPQFRLMSNISATRGHPDMRFVCVEAREEIFHT